MVGEGCDVLRDQVLDAPDAEEQKRRRTRMWVFCFVCLVNCQ